MQLPQKIDSLLKPDSESFLCCSGKDYQKIFRPHSFKQSLKLFEMILNRMGELSSKAQGLKSIITSSIKFIGSDQRIYIKVKDKQVLGFVKVGQKNLFHRDYIGNVKEIKPTCVLDIYVHESCQRSGVGKEVFQKFLKEESRIPERLAYDRPSEKLISFLKKHYGLVKFVPQNNNFVVFDKYFDKNLPSIQQVRPKSYTPSVAQLQKKESVKIEQTTAIKKEERYQQQISEQNTLNRNNQQPQLQTTHRQFKKQMLQQNNRIHNVTPLGTFMNTTISGTKHKNMSSEAFPLSLSYQNTGNPGFRTTSNTYGNYYKRR